MNRVELGNRLTELRDGMAIESEKLSAYAIQSIEAGRSSYAVTNLFLYTDAIKRSVYVWDYNLDEHYRIGSVEDCHEVIDYLLRYNSMEQKDISPRIGIRYTKPKDGQALLSIDTFLAILNHFRCSLQFDKA
jgi:hypothetical protein